MRFLVAFLFAATLHAQAILPPPAPIQRQCLFGANGLPTVPRPCFDWWNDPAVPLGRFQYGYSQDPLDYTLVIPECATASPCPVTLHLYYWERLNYSARRFNAIIDALPPILVDPFKSVGQGKLMDLKVPVFVAGGKVTLKERSVVGNPVLVGYSVEAFAAPATSGILKWLECKSATTPTWSCQQFYYLELKRPDGSTEKLWALPTVPGWAPSTDWLPITGPPQIAACYADLLYDHGPAYNDQPGGTGLRYLFWTYWPDGVNETSTRPMCLVRL